jgi:hypothetical protein
VFGTTHHLREVIAAIRSGAECKTPGFDGICLEFYSANWEMVHMGLLELLNQISLHKNTTPAEIGILICLPKTEGETPLTGTDQFRS